MIAIGNFFFKYRNFLFIILYMLLFVPSPAIFTQERLGNKYYLYPLIIGLSITIAGQIIRGLTIGLAYIIRGGKDGKVHAEDLVTSGIFNHCRNPLYLGNILMLLGVGILANSLIYLVIVMPVFIFIYQCIVLAEENFLRNKFGLQFENYCKKVNRWLPSLGGLSNTLQSMEFKWKRWLIKEYNTQFIWLTGIGLIVLFKYPQLTFYDENKRNLLLITLCIITSTYYLTIRYLKKSGKWKD